MKQSTSTEVRRARHRMNDHDHVHCAGCGEIVSGPHQATAQGPGRGQWARECSACGVTTWYDVEEIPADYPVQPLREGQAAKDRATCGTCGRSWDDGISTGMTPTPAGRCPFEAWHSTEED